MKKNKLHLMWWHWGAKNFGDQASPYIISRLTDAEVCCQNRTFFSELRLMISSALKGRSYSLGQLFETFKNGKKYLVGLGSIINLSSKSAMIWGSGFQDPSHKFYGGNIYAVRGKYTSEELVKRGFSKCDVWGDPGLLMPLLYQPKVVKQYEFGFIPHILEKETTKELLKQTNSKLIDLQTDDIEFVIKEILQCKRILSSSLHGLIIAHSYGIPALFVQYTHKGEGLFKYYDYFSSVGINEYLPIQLNTEIISTDEGLVNLFNKFSSVSEINYDLYRIQERLLNNAPFELRLDFKNENLKTKLKEEFNYINGLKCT